MKIVKLFQKLVPKQKRKYEKRHLCGLYWHQFSLLYFMWLITTIKDLSSLNRIYLKRYLVSLCGHLSLEGGQRFWASCYLIEKKWNQDTVLTFSKILLKEINFSYWKHFLPTNYENSHVFHLKKERELNLCKHDFWNYSMIWKIRSHVIEIMKVNRYKILSEQQVILLCLLETDTRWCLKRFLM